MSNTETTDDSHHYIQYHENIVEGHLKRRASKKGRMKKRNSSSSLSEAGSSRYRPRPLEITSEKSRKKKQNKRLARAFCKRRNAARFEKELNTTIYLLGDIVTDVAPVQEECTTDTDYKYGMDGSVLEHAFSVLEDGIPPRLDLLFVERTPAVSERTFYLNNDVERAKCPEDLLQMIDCVNLSEAQLRTYQNDKFPDAVQQLIDASNEVVVELEALPMDEKSIQRKGAYSAVLQIEVVAEHSCKHLRCLYEEYLVQSLHTQHHSSQNSTSSGGGLLPADDYIEKQLMQSFVQLAELTSDHCVRALKILKCCFAFESEKCVCFQKAHDILAVYYRVQDLEEHLFRSEVSSFQNAQHSERQLARKQTLVEFVVEANNCVLKLQEQTLLKEHMTPKSPGERSPFSPQGPKLSRFLKTTWAKLAELNRRVLLVCPEAKDDVYRLYFRTLMDAIEKSISIQHTEEIRENLADINCKGKYELKASSKEEVLCQKWLLPCLCKLQIYTSDFIKQIARQKPYLTRESMEVLEIQEQFRLLISVTVHRMLRATKHCEDLAQYEMESRKYYGSQTLLFIKEYFRGHLINKQAEMKGYDIMKTLLNELVSIICCYNEKLEAQKKAAGELPEHQIPSLQSSIVSGDTPNSTRTWLDRIGSLEVKETSLDKENSGSVEHDAGMELTPQNSLELTSPFNDEVDGGGKFSTMEAVIRETEEAEKARKDEEVAALYQDVGAGSGFSKSNSLDESLASSTPSLGQFGNIDKKALHRLNRLGSGSSALVWKMSHYGCPVAVKILKGFDESTTQTKTQKKMQKRLEREAEIHQRASHHDSIVRFFGKYVDKENHSNQILGLVLEFCDLGSLTEGIRSARGFKENVGIVEEQEKASVGYQLCMDWSKRFNVALDIARGMEYLHSKNIVHRDLTSYNVVLYSKGHLRGDFGAKICDFERANYVAEGKSLSRSKGMPNSPPWAAPEILKGGKYTTKADVFSFGVIVWELIFLEDPWEVLGRESANTRPEAILIFLTNGKRLPLDVSGNGFDDCAWLPSLIDLVKRTWKENPDERPTMFKVFEDLRSIKQKAACDIKSTQSKG